MRLWSIHPKYLDSKGLVALWREALLAKRVLEGRTERYLNHPQLDRFKLQKNPVVFINTYLKYILQEADKRGYSFDGRKIGRKFTTDKLEVTEGQLRYEFELLKKKLKLRNPQEYERIQRETIPEIHSLFVTIDGPVEYWEKIVE